MTAVTYATESLESTSASALELGAKRRFNLRKRYPNDDNKMNIASYNSAFLSGLFADVAKATESSEESPAETDTTTATSPSFEPSEEAEDPRLDPTLPVKRSRVSLTKSLSRSAKSYKNLALTEALSTIGVNMFHATEQPSEVSPSHSSSMNRINSLHFQLNCISSKPELVNRVSPTSVKEVVDLKNRVVDIIDLAFPHLPATVSDSSCEKQDLTPKSDRQVSDWETSTKESYGWFVDLDASDEDDQDRCDASDPYARSSSSDLAFTAPTAPKRMSNYEAEVEWAKAADTVDDVLGDLF